MSSSRIIELQRVRQARDIKSRISLYPSDQIDLKLLNLDKTTYNGKTATIVIKQGETTDDLSNVVNSLPAFPSSGDLTQILNIAADTNFAIITLTNGQTNALKDLTDYVLEIEIDLGSGNIDTFGTYQLRTDQNNNNNTSPALPAAQALTGKGGLVPQVKNDETGFDFINLAVLLAAKVDKVTGKGLSTNDLTNLLKTGYDAAAAWIGSNGGAILAHLIDQANPHNVTKAQVGLGNVTNTSDADKPISTAQQAALNNKADLVGGLVPSSQLPSYVDDVLEYNNLASFPLVGETGKIYVAKDTNLTYRWSGSTYGVLDPSLALGETSSTAYRGDRGKIAYDHSQTTGNPHGAVTDDIPESVSPTNLWFTGARALNTVLGSLTGLITNSAISTADTVKQALGKLQGQVNSLFDGSGKINSSLLPGFVDDVLEYSNFAALPATGETGKIYITIDTNFEYRWSGSTYVQITSGTALWGGVGGLLSNQTDLQNALNAKASLDSAGYVDQKLLKNTVYIGARTDSTSESNVATDITTLETTIGVTFDYAMIFLDTSSNPFTAGSQATSDYLPIKNLLDAGRNVFLNYQITSGSANLANIKNGVYDTQITNLANKIALDYSVRTVKPLFILTMMHEFNGSTYPWSIFYSGNTASDYIPAFQRISAIIKSICPFVKIVQHYNREDSGSSSGNNLNYIGDYYAGDSSCDLIGISHYNRGGLSYPNYHSFEVWFDQFYNQAQEVAPSKDFIIAETSTAPEGMIFSASLSAGGTGFSNGTFSTISNSADPDSINAIINYTVTSGVLSNPVLTARGARLGTSPTITHSTGGTGAVLNLNIANGVIQTKSEWVYRAFQSIALKYPKVKYVGWFIKNKIAGGEADWAMTTTQEKQAFRQGYYYLRNSVNTNPYRDPRSNANLMTLDPTLTASWTQYGANQGTIGTSTDIYNNTGATTQSITLTHNGTAGTSESNSMYMTGTPYTSNREITISGWFKIKEKVTGITAELGMQQSASTGRFFGKREKLDNKWKFLTIVVSTGWSGTFWLPFIRIGHNTTAFTLLVDKLKVELGNEPTPLIPSVNASLFGQITSGITNIWASINQFSSTATRSALRFVSGTAPSSPLEGETWNDGGDKALEALIGGIRQLFVGTPKQVTYITKTTVTNTTTKTALYTYALPANSWVFNKRVNFDIQGKYSTTGTPTLTFEINVSGVVMFTSSAITLPASVTDQTWKLTYKDNHNGGTGTGQSHTHYADLEIYSGGIMTAKYSLAMTGSLGIDTTASSPIIVNVTWSAASASNSIQCRTSSELNL